MQLTKQTKLLLILIILIGIFIRFYKLDWGGGYYFHPDERNIASLVTALDQKQGKDFFMQGTFAYGSLLAYIAHVLKPAIGLTGLCLGDNFDCSIMSLRIISAIA